MPSSQASPPPAGFFDRAKEGWFWYEDPPAPVLPPSPKPEQPAPPTSPPIRLGPMTWEDLKRLDPGALDLDTLPARWLKALTQAKLEYALDDPTPDRVKAYIVVQRAAFRRSERFSAAWQLVMYQHPDLDYATVHPTSEFGRRIEAEAAEAQEEQDLRALGERAGLFFFFTSTCRFCQEQAKVLRLFADTYGFSVLPITLDGRGLPEFPDANPDNGMAKRLEVRLVPMLYLAIPDERVLTPVGAGVLTLSELKDRILKLAAARPSTRAASAEDALGAVTPRQKKR